MYSWQNINTTSFINFHIPTIGNNTPQALLKYGLVNQPGIESFAQ